MVGLLQNQNKVAGGCIVLYPQWFCLKKRNHVVRNPEVNTGSLDTTDYILIRQIKYRVTKPQFFFLCLKNIIRLHGMTEINI